MKARKTCVDLVGQMDKLESSTASAIFELVAIRVELHHIHTQLEAGA
jgi:hypothetical protein